MINNRQNGRRRGRGGNNNQRSGGNPGRPDSGNRIDSRARGNANQLYEKYKNLARDAQMSGDRVNTEYYLQFADHYFRVLSESRMRFEEQNPNAAPQRRIQPVDSFDDFDDADDYGDEGEPIRAGEQQVGQNGQDTRHDQGQRGQRDARDNGGRDNGRDNGGRDNGGRQGQPRYDGRRDDRYEGARADTGRYDNARRNGPGDEGVRGDDRDQRFVPTAPAIANDLGANELGANDRGAGDRAENGADASPSIAAEPRRRGRPRRAVTDDAGADAPAALDADRLPPSLSIVTGTDERAGDGEDAPRPRRRRVRAAGETTPLG